MSYDRCRICKRRLKNPKARERGFGPVCAGKEREKQEQKKQMELPLPPG